MNRQGLQTRLIQSSITCYQHLSRVKRSWLDSWMAKIRWNSFVATRIYWIDSLLWNWNKRNGIIIFRSVKRRISGRVVSPKHLSPRRIPWFMLMADRSLWLNNVAFRLNRKLEDVQKTTAQFEQQMLSQSVPNVDYSSEMDSLSSIIRTFVHEKQQQLRSELEYKRQMLILDATDHRLVQAFFDLNPKKGTSECTSGFHLYSLNSILYFICLRLRFIQPDVFGKRQQSKSWSQKKWPSWNVVSQPGHCNHHQLCSIEW